MHIHLIAIGGAAMHNIALALASKGYTITGSDDEINEPSLSRLAAAGLLPATIGWDISKITAEIDAVILGMHARVDNPELLEAQKLGLKIYSYPEFLYEQSKDKTRIVIGGSHGKTTTTAMILHVLKACNIETDYMVGAKLEGFDTMVRLSHTAKYMVIEGDEYLASPIDRRPKFHLYKANIAVLTGIAWDHINVFPTFENYIEQFTNFIPTLAPHSTLIYFKNDAELKKIAANAQEMGHTILAYSNIASAEPDGAKTVLETADGAFLVKIFGEHNLQNMEAARQVCMQIGVSSAAFYEAICTFGGAANRLQLLAQNKKTAVYKDFAHSPSKLKATIEALKSQYPNRKTVACMELHTFSSLKLDFLSQYNGCMDAADIAIVYYNPQTIAHKKLENIDKNQVKAAFNKPGLKVFTNSEAMLNELFEIEFAHKNLVMMSSGTFDGVDLESLAYSITGNEVG